LIDVDPNKVLSLIVLNGHGNQGGINLNHFYFNLPGMQRAPLSFTKGDGSGPILLGDDDADTRRVFNTDDVHTRNYSRVG
jgi:hypothetical protein